MKMFKKVLVGAALVMVIILLVSLVYHNHLRKAAQGYKDALKEGGAIMELKADLPPVPSPEKDGTTIFRQAATLLKTNYGFLDTNYFEPMQMVAWGKASISWQQPDFRDGESTNSWEDMEAAVREDQPLLDLLSQLPDHPEFNFQLHYELGCKAYIDFTNLYSVELKRSANHLAKAILVDLHRGDLTAAINHEQAILTLVQAAQSQRLVISGLIGSAILSIAERCLWSIIQSPGFTDAQLAQLQADVGRIDLLGEFANALNMERLCQEISLNDWRRSDPEMKRFIHLNDDPIEVWGGSLTLPQPFTEVKNHAKIFLWRYWWSYSDESRFEQANKILLDGVCYARTNGNYENSQRYQQTELARIGLTNEFNFLLAAFGSDESDLHSLLSSSTSGFIYGFERLTTDESARQIAVTAIALKRFELKHGQYPENLSQLVPEFLVAIPLDPMNGDPLHYRRRSNEAFLLYSVGENGVDDGGDPAFHAGVKSTSYFWVDGQARDWVWPQVASPAEIQNFREHPPK
jgi:hypothetical protein